MGKRVLSLRRSSGDCHSIFSSSLLLRRGKKRAWEGERRRKESGDTSTPISASFPPIFSFAHISFATTVDLLEGIDGRNAMDGIWQKKEKGEGDDAWYIRMGRKLC